MERTYKGWKIITRDGEFWIYPLGEIYASDICATLREARAMIDQYIEKGE